MERRIELGTRNKAQGTDNGPHSQVQHLILSKLPGKPPHSPRNVEPPLAAQKPRLSIREMA
jgi:hypothetical protein